MNEPAKVAERAAEPETNRAAEAEQLRARYRVRLMNALFGIGTVGLIAELVWLTNGYGLLLFIPLAPGLMMTAARIGIQTGVRAAGPGRVGKAGAKVSRFSLVMPALV